MPVRKPRQPRSGWHKVEETEEPPCCYRVRLSITARRLSVIVAATKPPRPSARFSNPFLVRATAGRLGRASPLAVGENVASKWPAKRGCAPYTGTRAWEKNKGLIMALMDPFFEGGHNNRYLRRKG